MFAETGNREVRRNDRTCKQSLQKDMGGQTMTRGYNRAVIMGNVVRDPEIRALKNDQKVGNMTVAVSTLS